MNTIRQERLTRAERKAETRRSLLESAREQVAKHGMAGARVDEIAAGAGLTMGAVYSNFANKADLLFAMFDQVASASAGSLLEIFADEGATLESCVGAVGELCRRLADEEPEVLVLQLEFVGYVLRDPEARERRVDGHRLGSAILADRFEAVARANHQVLPTSAHEFAELVPAVFMSLAAARAWLGRDVISDELFAVTARQLCAAPPEPRKRPRRRG